MKVAVVLVVCLLHVVNGANPNYSYHVKIDDPAHINFQEKAETRKGEDAQGFYSVLEPNGALRTVSYIADERGFNPVVSYSYGHPQSSVTVHSATGAASIRQPGVYAPAYVTDNRVQITDKSNIYAAPPPALNVQAFALPGPSAPVVVSQPLRQAVPVVKASAAIAANYAPAYVPPPQAYLPPPQPQVVVQQQPQVVAVPQPQVLALPQPPPPPPPPQVFVQKQQVLAVPQPQVIGLAPPPVTYVKRVRPAKVLAAVAVPQVAPAVKVIKSRPVIATDSYAVPPRDTFRDPNAPSYPDAVPAKISEPTAEYGPPSYVPPAPLAFAEPPPVKVVQPAVAKVVQPVIATKVVQPVTVAKYVQPPPAVAVQPVAPVQKVVAQQAYVNNGLYAGAIGFHTHTTAPQSYIHSYGTQGFQVTSSRQYNKAILTVPKQIVRAPTPVYGPPPAVNVVQPAPVYGPPPAVAVQTVQPAPVYGPPPSVAVQTVQPAPVYGPPAVAIRQPQPVYGPPPAVAIQHAPVRVVQPKPVYGPPPAKFIQPQLTAVAVPAPQPVVQTAVAAAVPAAPLLQAAPVAITGKKKNPLTFAYSYDQGGAKVTHSYSGSGW